MGREQSTRSPPSDPQDLPDQGRGEDLAGGRSRPTRQGRPPGSEAHHDPVGVGGVVRGREGRDDPQPLGRSFQALRAPRLQGGDAPNAKALSTFMGHANISITLDRYGHLMPGNEAEARALLDAYLAREGG